MFFALYSLDMKYIKDLCWKIGIQDDIILHGRNNRSQVKLKTVSEVEQS